MAGVEFQAKQFMVNLGDNGEPFQNNQQGSYMISAVLQESKIGRSARFFRDYSHSGHQPGGTGSHMGTPEGLWRLETPRGDHALLHITAEQINCDVNIVCFRLELITQMYPLGELI